MLVVQGAGLRNFTQWPIWGVPLVNEPTPMANTYGQEIANLKTFIRNRLAWLDSRWTLNGGCPFPLSINATNLNNIISVYPVPTSNDVQIELGDFKSRDLQIALCNLQGQCLHQETMTLARHTLSLRGLSSGVYFVRITDQTTQQQYIRKVIKN